MQPHSPKRQMLRGSIWAIALRWSVRLSGLVSTIILARLLTPSDYGVVSIAAIIVNGVEIFSQTGQDAALIRHPNPTREHFDSAWTIQLLLGVGLGILIWATIPIATSYFHEPRAGSVVAILAFRTMIMGGMNTGILNFQRRLEFSKQFVFSICPPLISFVVTVAAALILRNYWALVIGLMSKTISSVVLSYVLESFRPRFAVTKVREIWSFSIWSMIRAIGLTINYQVDKIAIGGFAGTASMGRYDVARDFATSPTQELILPMVTVLMPVMARVQHDKVALRELYLNVLYLSALICVSTSVGIALIAKDLADLVLGPKWGDVARLMPWFALAWGVSGISWSVSSTLETINRPMISARLQWIRVLILTIAVSIVAYKTHSIIAVAITSLIVAVVMTPIAFYALSRAAGIPIRVFPLTLWRPMLAGLLMAMAVLAVNSMIEFTGIQRLLLDVAVGAITYTTAVMLLWYIIGRPGGIEEDACQATRNLKRRIFGSVQAAAQTTAPPPEEF